MTKNKKNKFAFAARSQKPKVSNIEVNIVTPVYGSPHFLEAMLESLLKFDAGISWDITLVDDLGPDREKVDAVYEKYTQLDNRIKVHRNKQNLGFAGSNNVGFIRGAAPLLLLLNSDTLICQNNWLKLMADEFKVPHIGVVGPKLIFFDEGCPNYDKEIAATKAPPGMIQHAGVAFNLLGQPFHIFMGWHPDHPKVTERLEVNCVTGACIMTRRTFYFGIGGLDVAYTTGNFEDVQFCLQMRMSGAKVIYLPTVTLYHFAGGSGNTATARFNESLFQIKCKDFIEYDDWKRY